MFAVTQARSKIEQLVSLRKSLFERALAMPEMHRTESQLSLNQETDVDFCLNFNFNVTVILDD